MKTLVVVRSVLGVVRGGGGGYAWGGVLDEVVEPVEHFGEDVLNGFTRGVAVGFVGKRDVADGAAVALDSAVHAVGLDREGAGVIVGFTVNQKNGDFNLVGEHEGRKLEVEVGRLPERAAFVLKTEGSERAVVGAAAGDSGAEEVGVREKIRGHEGTVTVAADADTIGIDDAHVRGFVYGGFGAGGDLLDVCVVDGFGIADDGHGGAVENDVAINQEE